MSYYNKYNSNTSYYTSNDYYQYRPLSYGTYERSSYNNSSILSSYYNNYKYNENYSAYTVNNNSYKNRSIYK